MRTLDWACQWCGYPLLTGNYHKIAKTYKQLQEERRIPVREPVAEDEAQIEAQVEQPRKPPSEPQLSIRPPARDRPVPKPEPLVQSAPQPEFETEVEPPVDVAPTAEIETVPETPPPPAKPELMPEASLVPEVGQQLKKDAAESLPAPSQPIPLPAAFPPPAPAPQVDVKALLEKDVFTADELDLLFQADRIAAGAKFEEKVLTVSGAIDRVFTNDGLGIHYVVLGNAQRSGIWNVRCTFEESYVSELKKLSPGQPLIVRGKYGGYGKNIILRDCIVPAAD
ncbi:MAG: hypothetical protein PHR43_07645 [Dehalococcoidales bacterium]|nr:hypothetical protein [Dehalococcoidales bacterium]